MPSAAALLGVSSAEDRLDLRARVGEARRVAVVLIDGMGSRLLPAMAEHAPLLAAVLAGELGCRDELTCTFPSTTPTSIVSLSTGLEPGEHGILGFTLNIPGTDRLVTHIVWRDDPPPRQWQPVPTWYERLSEAGTDAAVVLPAVFEGSGLTDAAYRGARFVGVGRDDDYVERFVNELATGPGLAFGYFAALDTAAHVFGIASEEWAKAAAAVDALLTRIVERLPTDAALLVTADHGGLDIDPTGRIDIGTDPNLSAGLRVVAGEPRVRYLHTVEGAVPDVLATWREIVGDRAQVLMRDEAVAAGLFGSVRPEHLQRIGDVVVVCTADIAIIATGYEPPEMAKLIGFHGALSPAETAIPLLAIRG